MNSRTQIHSGKGDNLQDSTKYQHVGNVVINDNKKPPERNIIVVIVTTLLIVFFVVLSPLWMPFLCPLLTDNQYIYQAIRSLNILVINGAELCKPIINP